MRHKYMTVIILLVAAVLLANCAGSFADQPNQNEDRANPVEIETESEPIPADPSETPIEESPAIVSGNVPKEIMDQIFADLMKSTGIGRDDIKAVMAEAVVWNDGSLGCPKPGEFYIQMMINGYWVVMMVDGLEYDYRVSDKGSFRLCVGENMPPISSPDLSIQNPLVAQAMDDLAVRLGVSESEIELLNIKEVTWRDGSLGCPRPGMLYTQALVNGSLIQLVHDGLIFQYHSGRGGKPFLCENPPKDMNEAITPEEAPPPGLSSDE